jgi:hypothetical protein
MSYSHISSRATVKAPYRLDSIDTVPAPKGCDGTWFRYVISQGDNKIVGMRCGMHSEVSVVLTDYVERLNMRSGWQQVRKPGR